MSEDQKVVRSKSNSKAHLIPEVRAKHVQSAKKRRATERRDELEHARQIAVPFEKSKKRRAELRAASEHTKPSSCRGDRAVLYMYSEDRKDIRRVDKEGLMRERDIVGPVVDPPPPDAFDSD